VAVSHERAHAEGPARASLPVVGFGLLASSGGLALRRNVAEEWVGIRPPRSWRSRASASACSARAWASSRRSASMRLPGRDDSAPDCLLFRCSRACSIACVSSGMASVIRPPRVYAAPKATAIQGNKAGCRLPDRRPWPVRAGERPAQIAWRRASRPAAYYRQS
jgi:hypothetical protein